MSISFFPPAPFARLVRISAMVAVILAPGLANATVITGSSTAFGESVSLTIDPLIGIQAAVGSGPFPSISGTAPTPYDESDALLSISVGGLLSTDVLSASAASDVDGFNGARMATASTEVNGLSISLLDNLILADELLNLSAGTITSNATAQGDHGALTASGSTVIESLTLNGLLSATVLPDPNEVLLDALGIKVVLNEQVMTGDGISAIGLAVNALHVSLTNVLGLLDGKLGFINGDIIIGHSEASLLADPTPNSVSVPAPAPLFLLGGGLIMLAGLRRCARRG